MKSKRLQQPTWSTRLLCAYADYVVIPSLGAVSFITNNCQVRHKLLIISSDSTLPIFRPDLQLNPGLICLLKRVRERTCCPIASKKERYERHTVTDIFQKVRLMSAHFAHRWGITLIDFFSYAKSCGQEPAWFPSRSRFGFPTSGRSILLPHRDGTPASLNPTVFCVTDRVLYSRKAKRKRVFLCS